MKAFGIAVAVTLVLAFVCFVESSALPFAGEPEPEEAGSNDTPVADAEHPDMLAHSWMMPAHVREKRHQSHLSLCRWPVALTPVAMKCLEKLVLVHLNNIVPDTIDPLQFAYRPNRSVDDAVSVALHHVMQHLDYSGTYVRTLFLDYNSAFNTIRPVRLIEKLAELGIPTPTCNWILDFLIERPQVTKEVVIDFRRNLLAPKPLTIKGTEVEQVDSYKFLGLQITSDLSWKQNTAATVKRAQQRLYFIRMLRKSGLKQRPLTQAYRGPVESILCTGITVWIKSTFADDTAVVGLISGDDETVYRSEINHLIGWCKDNNFELNIGKTKELVVDFRRNKRLEKESSLRSENVHPTCASHHLAQSAVRPLGAGSSSISVGGMSGDLRAGETTVI
ncbi:hypothetical protein WMY93_025705 [Mugilogobius chulae]|uniref:Reverse transcriptase domain-containing protein n=1 Tax=Mugilogobius chulae TaxID=88201 RepID=A0AAW0MYX2_9GOBI